MTPTTAFAGTAAAAVRTGRSDGEGIWELEPAAAEQLPAAPPACACGGLAAGVVARCRAAWSALRDHRTGRVPR
jgi:hypothetical protein